jgi:hypothetical protein
MTSKSDTEGVFNIDVTMVLGSTEYELEKGALSNLLQPAVVVRIRDRNSNVIGKTSKGKKKAILAVNCNK